MNLSDIEKRVERIRSDLAHINLQRAELTAAARLKAADLRAAEADLRVALIPEDDRRALVRSIQAVGIPSEESVQGGFVRFDMSLVWMLIALAIVMMPILASAQSLDQATLTWDPVVDAQEYRVYRADQQANGSCPLPPYGQPIGTVQAPTVTYVDAPLPRDESFCWYVTAWNVDHPESGASNVVWKRIPLLLPTPPVNLRVVSQPVTE